MEGWAVGRRRGGVTIGDGDGGGEQASGGDGGGGGVIGKSRENDSGGPSSGVTKKRSLGSSLARKLCLPAMCMMVIRKPLKRERLTWPLKKAEIRRRRKEAGIWWPES